MCDFFCKASIKMILRNWWPIYWNYLPINFFLWFINHKPIYSGFSEAFGGKNDQKWTWKSTYYLLKTKICGLLNQKNFGWWFWVISLPRSAIDPSPSSQKKIAQTCILKTNFLDFINKILKGPDFGAKLTKFLEPHFWTVANFSIGRLSKWYLGRVFGHIRTSEKSKKIYGL